MHLRIWLAVSAGYGALTAILTWPLPLHLRTHLLGDPGGDLGVYVWNVWIFWHELISHRRVPFSTDHLFAYTGGADFSLHNYTPIAGALGSPLIGLLGVVGAFNVVFLGLVVGSAVGVFVLARRLGLGPVAAWCAGAAFIASPVLVAKQTAHFSLVSAAALPLFLWALLRTLDSRRAADAVLTGFFVAVASYSDAYYGIYCAMMGAFVIAWRFMRIRTRGMPAGASRLTMAADIVMLASGTLIAWRLLSGTTVVDVGPIRIGLETLYTPVLILVSALGLRGWLAWRPVPELHDPERQLPRLRGLGLLAVGVCLAAQLPLIVGIALRAMDGRLPATATHWRSSPRGIDALALFVPNQNHPWFGDRTRGWFMPPVPDAFPEFVGSFSLVALATIAAGAWIRGLPRFWIAFTGFFMLLSLGPFIHIAGINTQVIGPWALLRYVPVVGMARSPSRFAVVAVLGLSLLFAFSLEALYRRSRAWGSALACALAVTLAIELMPAPRLLHSAAVPDVYQLVTANADESGRLLELPTGIRDGASSLGDFSPATQFFQTRHRRPLIGGYLSRVSGKRKSESRRTPMLRALHWLSEGREPPVEWLDDARRSRDAFLRRSCVTFVVVNKRRASPPLRAFAMEALELKLVHEDADYVLFKPGNAPPCDPPRARSGRRFRDANW